MRDVYYITPYHQRPRRRATVGFFGETANGCGVSYMVCHVSSSWWAHGGALCLVVLCAVLALCASAQRGEVNVCVV